MGNKTGDLIFNLVMVALLTGGVACSDDTDSSAGKDSESEDSETETGSDSASIDAETDDTETPQDSDTLRETCPINSWDDIYHVDAIDGISANAQEICDFSEDTVDASSDAVSLQLIPDADALKGAEGMIHFADGLSGFVVGTPTITIESANPFEFSQSTISALTATDDGFGFRITFPSDSGYEEYLPIQPYEGVSVNLAVSFTMDCTDAGVDKTVSVRAEYPLRFCGVSSETYSWRGPEQNCQVCNPMISEISAIPIPEKINREGVLCGPMQASIQPVGENGHSC